MDRRGSSDYFFRPVDYKQLLADICSVKIFFTFNEAKKEVETTIYTGNGATFVDKNSWQTKDEISWTILKQNQKAIIV